MHIEVTSEYKMNSEFVNERKIGEKKQHILAKKKKQNLKQSFMYTVYVYIANIIRH